MSIDNELRATLRTHADEATPPGDLLSAVHARSRRFAVRRRVSLVVLTMVAAVLVAAGPFALHGWDGGHRNAPGPAASDVTASSRPPSPSPNGMAFEPATALPTFPYTPTWEPDWADPRSFGHTAVVGAFGPLNSLVYERRSPQERALNMHQYPSEPSPPDPSITTTRAITVLGRPARLHLTGPPGETGAVSVVWQDSDRTWWLVIGLGGTTEAEVLSFVAGLQPQPLRVTTSVRCPLLPAGLVLNSLLPQRKGLAFSRRGPDGPAPDPVLYVSVVLPNSAGTGEAVPVTVGGRRAEFLPRPERAREMTGVRVFDDSWKAKVLYVIVDHSLGMTRADLLAFAATIHVDPAAIPAQ